MALDDLSFIDEARALEVEAIEPGCTRCDFTFAPGQASLGVAVSENDEEALNGRPVDDVIEIGERIRDLPRYVDLAKVAFQQRGLEYPFEIDESRQSLALLRGGRRLASKVADLSRIVRHGQKDAANFEKRAFRSLHKLIGGWGVCVGAPREALQMGEERTIRKFRDYLLPHECGSEWPTDFSPNGDHGADGFIILGRGWGGPIAFYQSKNTGFDLENYPEEFGRIPAIAEAWFGKKVDLGRQVIPVLALNTVLTIDLKEKIYSERGRHGVHIIDAVDILAAEEVSPTHQASQCECLVL